MKKILEFIYRPTSAIKKIVIQISTEMKKSINSLIVAINNTKVILCKCKTEQIQFDLLV